MTKTEIMKLLEIITPIILLSMSAFTQKKGKISGDITSKNCYRKSPHNDGSGKLYGLMSFAMLLSIGLVLNYLIYYGYFKESENTPSLLIILNLVIILFSRKLANLRKKNSVEEGDPL